MKLTEPQQEIWQQLAHAYTIFWNAEESLENRRRADDDFRALIPKAKELGVDPNAVALSVDEMKENAKLAGILQEQYNESPELFTNVRPGLLKRFVRTRKEQ